MIPELEQMLTSANTLRSSIHCERGTRWNCLRMVPIAAPDDSDDYAFGFFIAAISSS